MLLGGGAHAKKEFTQLLRDCVEVISWSLASLQLMPGNSDWKERKEGEGKEGEGEGTEEGGRDRGREKGWKEGGKRRGRREDGRVSSRTRLLYCVS